MCIRDRFQADINGDGVPDTVSPQWEGWVSRVQQKFFTDRLVQVSDGATPSGVRTDAIVYDSEIPENHTNCGYPHECVLAGRPVVRSHYSWTGAQLHASLHHYDDPHADLVGRDWLGW